MNHVLEHPFDAEYILAHKKQIRRKLLDADRDFMEKRVALLGGSTTGNILAVLELFLLYHGIRPVFYESDYNRYYEDAMFWQRGLKDFRLDIIYIHTSNRNVTAYPGLDDTADTIDRMLEEEYERFYGMWERLADLYGVPVIQNNFEMPFYRLLGNKDVSDIHGAGNYLMRLNMKFYEYAQTHENFFICDIQYISADYGLKKWSDPFYWYMYKYALNADAVPYLAFHVANIMKSIFGKNKKGFVLDLDNTLWGGVIGDDGPEGIVLGPEEPGGEAYLEFQKYIRAHKKLGVVLNVNSKNETENALAGLAHPGGVLKPEDFIVIKADWEPKNENFAAIADTLGLLPESLLFVDDNAAERLLVTESLRGVTAPQIGEVHQYIQNIDRGGYFETTILSGDDRRRSDMYRQNVKRQQSAAQFTDYRSFLISLQMRAVITGFEADTIPRVMQLANKSNQFHLTLERYTQADLTRAAQAEDVITLCGRLEDRFGDNGIVSALAGHIRQTLSGPECVIRLWVMSCRVLGRGMEDCMMDALVHACLERGVGRIVGLYHPGKKNGMVKDFYGTQGFTQVNKDESGDTQWLYEIPAGYKDKNTVIQQRTQ